MGGRATLRVGSDETILVIDESRWSGRAESDLRLIDIALRRLRRVHGRDSRDTGPLLAAVHRVGAELSAGFLGGDVGAVLAEAVGHEAAAGSRLRLGVEIIDLALNDLPWETMLLPGTDQPLGLHPSVDLYRTVVGAAGRRPEPLAGPLRILAAVASPERGTSRPLSYERESPH